jgi:hypothetical protein
MATIYSYPEVTRLRGDDVLILSKSKGKKRTYSVSVNKIADHVSGFIELGNNSSAIDFVSDLQDYITIENNVFTISGYATNSSVEAVADSVANLSLTTTSDLNGATAALAISLTAEYTSYIGTELSSYSTASVVAEQIATATGDLAGAQAFTTLQSQFGTFDEEGNLLSVSESFANSVIATENTSDYAAASDITKLNSQFGFDESGDITGLSEANVDIVRNAVAGDGYATAENLETLRVTVEGEEGEVGLVASVETISQAQIGVTKTFNQDDAPSVDNPTNSVWYDTNDGNKAYILQESVIPANPKEWVELTDERLGELDSIVNASVTFKVDAGGDNVAGMKIGANDVDGGYISFLADTFRIYNGSQAETPFEIVDGTVKIKSANIGTVSFGDLSDTPSSFTTTIIYAEDASGTNASTTKGALAYVAFYSGTWADGDSVSGITFDKIAGTDGTSVNIIGSVDTVNDLPTSGVTNGDGYLVNGDLYVWDGSAWVNAGNIQGPQGAQGQPGNPGNPGNPGVNGKKTAKGVVFYQSGSTTAPTALVNDQYTFDFDAGSFTNLHSSWGEGTPEMAAGTASNKYWTSSYYVTEDENSLGVAVFQTPIRSFAFNQVVTFDSLSTSGSTIINGNNITSGIIKNNGFLGSSNWDAFSTSGTGINLDLGAINAENFFIAPDGTSSFTGSHDGGTLGGWEISPSKIYKESTDGAISLSSDRNAIEIFDADNKLCVDINNNDSLSSVSGASYQANGQTFNATPISFSEEEPHYQRTHIRNEVEIFAGGDLWFDPSAAGSEETLRVSASIGSAALLSVSVDYSAQWDIRLGTRMVMQVYSGDSANKTAQDPIIATVYKDVTVDYDYTDGDNLTIYANDGDSTDFTATFEHVGTAYYVKFYNTNHFIDFYGDFDQASVDLTGNFYGPNGTTGQSAEMKADSNKTEIIAGGFQVVKSASQYLRADRNGQSWLSSSGTWTHNGNIVQTSDINQKYNIKPIDFDLALLDTIDGYTYSQLLNPVNELGNLKSEDIHTTENAGLIAQEIEKVLPSAVTTTENGTKALDYSATVGLLLSIVKKLNNKIDILNSEVQKLKQK